MHNVGRFREQYVPCTLSIGLLQLEPAVTKPWHQAISTAFPLALKLELEPAVPFQGSQTARSVLQGRLDGASTPSLKYGRRYNCGRGAYASAPSEINSNISWNFDATHDTNVHTEKVFGTKNIHLNSHISKTRLREGCLG